MKERCANHQAEENMGLLFDIIFLFPRDSEYGDYAVNYWARCNAALERIAMESVAVYELQQTVRDIWGFSLSLSPDRLVVLGSIRRQTHLHPMRKLLRARKLQNRLNLSPKENDLSTTTVPKENDVSKTTLQKAKEGRHHHNLSRHLLLTVRQREILSRR